MDLPDFQALLRTLSISNEESGCSQSIYNDLIDKNYHSTFLLHLQNSLLEQDQETSKLSVILANRMINETILAIKDPEFHQYVKTSLFQFLNHTFYVSEMPLIVASLVSTSYRIYRSTWSDYYSYLFSFIENADICKFSCIVDCLALSIRTESNDIASLIPILIDIINKGLNQQNAQIIVSTFRLLYACSMHCYDVLQVIFNNIQILETLPVNFQCGMMSDLYNFYVDSELKGQLEQYFLAFISFLVSISTQANMSEGARNSAIELIPKVIRDNISQAVQSISQIIHELIPVLYELEGIDLELSQNEDTSPRSEMNVALRQIVEMYSGNCDFSFDIYDFAKIAVNETNIASQYAGLSLLSSIIAYCYNFLDTLIIEIIEIIGNYLIDPNPLLRKTALECLSSLIDNQTHYLELDEEKSDELLYILLQTMEVEMVNPVFRAQVKALYSFIVSFPSTTTKYMEQILNMYASKVFQCDDFSILYIIDGFIELISSYGISNFQSYHVILDLITEIFYDMSNNRFSYQIFHMIPCLKNCFENEIFDDLIDQCIKVFINEPDACAYRYICSFLKNVFYYNIQFSNEQMQIVQNYLLNSLSRDIAEEKIPLIYDRNEFIDMIIKVDNAEGIITCYNSDHFNEIYQVLSVAKIFISKYQNLCLNQIDLYVSIISKWMQFIVSPSIVYRAILCFNSVIPLIQPDQLITFLPMIIQASRTITDCGMLVKIIPVIIFFEISILRNKAPDDAFCQEIVELFLNLLNRSVMREKEKIDIERNLLDCRTSHYNEVLLQMSLSSVIQPLFEHCPDQMFSFLSLFIEHFPFDISTNFSSVSIILWTYFYIFIPQCNDVHNQIFRFILECLNSGKYTLVKNSINSIISICCNKMLQVEVIGEIYKLFVQIVDSNELSLNSNIGIAGLIISHRQSHLPDVESFLGLFLKSLPLYCDNSFFDNEYKAALLDLLKNKSDKIPQDKFSALLETIDYLNSQY